MSAPREERCQVCGNLRTDGIHKSQPFYEPAPSSRTPTAGAATLRFCDGCGKTDPLGYVTPGHAHYCGGHWQLASVPAEPTRGETTLTPEQQRAGIAQARRIIREAAGYYFGGELIPFAPEFKSLALDALDALRSTPDAGDRR